MENILENRWGGIINNKYVTYFQPQYNIVTGDITGFEALARLNDPDGLVSPAKFISVLENNRMIGKLDSFIFESVCKFIKQCRGTSEKIVPVFVNISHNDFYEKDFIANLDQIRKRYDVDQKNIVIELTDILPTRNKMSAVEIIREFHQYGYKVSLDNYAGKGLTPDVIREVRFDTVKLDLRGLSEQLDANERKLIASIIDSVKKIGLEIESVGVETKEQVEYLKSRNCKLAQGYFYSKPVAEDKAMAMLTKTDDGPLSSSARQKLEEAEAYKARIDSLLEQADIYYWEYNVSTKTMYPGPRSIRNFNLGQTVENCPKALIDAGVVTRDYAQQFTDFFKMIDNGTKHFETVIPFINNKDFYILRSDTEFNRFGKPVKAFCSAVRLVDNRR